jgi:hypothetical protein
MSPTKSEQLIIELKAWADEERGRRSMLARRFGVTRQIITNWFALRRNPSFEDGLKIQEFLIELKTASPSANPKKQKSK